MYKLYPLLTIAFVSFVDYAFGYVNAGDKCVLLDRDCLEDGRVAFCGSNQIWIGLDCPFGLKCQIVDGKARCQASTQTSVFGVQTTTLVQQTTAAVPTTRTQYIQQSELQSSVIPNTTEQIAPTTTIENFNSTTTAEPTETAEMTQIATETTEGFITFTPAPITSTDNIPSPTVATFQFSKSYFENLPYCTQQEFDQALALTNFPAPSYLQYQEFINTIAHGQISSKLELAMFLAQMLHESIGLIHKEEISCANNACPNSYNTAQDYQGKQYYGRGYVQLSWYYNYAAASMDLFGDLRLAQDPDSVAKSERLAWAVSFWYWKTSVRTRQGVAQGYFGTSTDAINGALECRGAYVYRARERFDIYTKVLKAFGINETPIESGCYN